MNAYRLVFVLTLLVGLSPAGEAARRPYRYYLDPTRAEEILAGVTLRQPMTREEWLEKLGKRGAAQGRGPASKDDKYMVIEGDNLWRVAGKELGDPWLWRKIWQVNPFLSNPHQVDVGAMLSFYGNDEGTSNWQVPVVKLYPGGKGGSDLDLDIVLTRGLRNSSRAIFIVVEEDRFLGSIRGSTSDQLKFAEMDPMYLELKAGTKVTVGDRFAVVKVAGTLRPKKGGLGNLGTMVRVQAEVEVAEIGERYAKAYFRGMFAPVERGDLLMTVPPPINWSSYFLPPDDLRAQILMGEDPWQRYFKQGELLVLDKGSEDGMKEGFVFRIYREFDPVMRKKDTVNADYKGEVQVIQVSRHASVGFLIRNSDIVQAGDHLVPAQAFTDPPESIVTETNYIEIP